MTIAAPSASNVLLRLPGWAGRQALGALGDTGRLTIFVRDAIASAFRRPFRFVQMVVQFEFIGARSTGIVALAAVFTGLVLALQGYNVLVRFGSENQVGTLVALSLVRELAPVLTALMVTARAGSAIAATIGNMAVTEQIDALRSLAIDPVQYLVVPRLVGAMVAVPLLTALFSLAGIGAAYVFGVTALGLDGLSFMSNIRRSVEWNDVSVGLCKGLIFGILIACIATFRGYHTRGGAAGVGRATTRTVVDCAVLVLGGDYVITALFF
jgi:phospholipid/cholesterol/gamma-HCH transport system permease protein